MCKSGFFFHFTERILLTSCFLFSPLFFSMFFVSSSIFISQVSVGTQQTWSAGAKHLAKTSSLLRSPRLSWSWCGRPYRTSRSSSWRPLPSSPLASLSTSLPERILNVRGRGGGRWCVLEGARCICKVYVCCNTKSFSGDTGCEKL